MGYFKQVPNWMYTSRLKSKNSDYDFVEVKNFYRRAKVRSDFFDRFTTFEKYQIIGDERPDNVAKTVYNDPELDWVILTVNNIMDFNTEWPLPQASFEKFLLQKYGTIQGYNQVHHFETEEVKDSRGRVVLPAGIEVDEDYEFTYTDGDTEVLDSDVTIEVTNKDYEIRLQDELRNIYVMKPIFLQTFLNDVDEIMEYPKKTSSYIGSRLKQGGSRPTDY